MSARHSYSRYSPVRRYLAMAGGALAGLAMIVGVAGQAGGAWDLSIRATSGGGGTSTGGGYSLTGVIGQPAASVSSNGRTSLASGLLGGAVTKFTRVLQLLSADGVGQ